MITLKEIKELHKLPNKTSSVLQKYIFNWCSIYLTYFFANKTKLSPNQITFIGIIIYCFSLFSLFNQYYLVSFFLYWISFVFDIIDGNIARIKKQTSLVGAYIDIIFDWIRPSFFYLFIYFYYKSTNILLYLIIINFLAAGSWRIYLNLVSCEKNSIEHVKVRLDNKIKKIYYFISKISSIEIEFLVSLYLLLPIKLFLYLALIVRIKDMIKNIFSSILKLKQLDNKK